MKNKYFKILGLRPGASQDEIKKAYRLSALKYHPDKNEGDAEKFLLISEAYEFLIENEQNENTDSEYEYYAKKASNSSIKRGKNNYSPEEFEQRLQWAKEKYQEKRYQEYVDDNRFYLSLTTGWKIKYFYFLTGICILVSMLFLADNTMETKTVNSIINYKDNTGQVAVPSRDLFYIEIDNQAVFILSKDFPTLYSTTNVVTKKTPIFNEIVAIETKDVFGEDKTILPQFSISSTFPLVTLILLAPLLVLIFKRRTPLFIFLFLTCSFLFPIIIVILFSVNNRFFALLN